MKILFYKTKSGRCPVEDFIRTHPPQHQAAIVRTLELLAEGGFEAPGVSLRQVKGKLWEVRITTAGSSRIFYVVRRGKEEEEDGVAEPEMILLHGYLKKSQKAPQKEIELAERRMWEVLR